MLFYQEGNPKPNKNPKYKWVCLRKLVSRAREWEGVQGGRRESRGGRRENEEERVEGGKEGRREVGGKE
jgi:hypothetical protein